MKRATFLPLVAAGLLAAAPTQQHMHIVTFRDRGCGCCEGWVNAARAAGYVVALTDLDRDVRLKRFALTDTTAGCHTSLVDGYVVEGHVPLQVLARLLRERPHLRGITVPGMPTGVPGMDGPRLQPLEVMTLAAHPRVYARV